MNQVLITPKGQCKAFKDLRNLTDLGTLIVVEHDQDTMYTDYIVDMSGKSSMVGI